MIQNIGGHRPRQAVPRSAGPRSRMSQSTGGHRPTNRARRSALPRSSWSTVFARIQRPMQSPMAPSEAPCSCQLRRPASWRAFVSMRARLPARRAGLRLMARGRRVGTGLVPKRPSRARRLATAARWPVGVGLTSWSYMWRTTPMHRREEIGSVEDDRPPELAPEVSRGEIQPASDGVGPLFHRRYAALVREPRHTPEELIARVTTNLNKVTPTSFAVF